MYNVFNGTSYDSKTSSEVIGQLETARLGGSRVRLFYGNSVTGEDWFEENDITGRIGRSTGLTKIPILLHNCRSHGGSGILDSCIVKLLVDGKEVYKHPLYETSAIAIILTDKPEKYTHNAKINGELRARFKTLKAAFRWKDFMTGKRMTK